MGSSLGFPLGRVPGVSPFGVGRFGLPHHVPGRAHAQSCATRGPSRGLRSLAALAGVVSGAEVLDTRSRAGYQPYPPPGGYVLAGPRVSPPIPRNGVIKYVFRNAHDGQQFLDTGDRDFG